MVAGRNRARRGRTAIALGGAALAACIGLVGCGGGSAKPQSSLGPFLSAWTQGDWQAMSSEVAAPAADFVSSGRTLAEGLGASRSTHVLGTVDQTGSTAAAQITSTYAIPGVGPWTVHSTVDLVKRSGRWLISWSPTVVDPLLGAGDRLSFAYDWPSRAAIVGAGGAALTTEEPEVVVGVEGSRIKDPSQVTSLMVAAGANPQEVSAALAAAAAHPTYFEPVFTLSKAAYDQLGGEQSELYQVAGSVFQDTSSRGAITPGLAAHLIGSVGPITAEQLDRLGAPYSASSVVGQTGLEASYQSQLGGSPGATIMVVDSAGRTIKTVATFAAKPGAPLRTSIDPQVQTAAESALAGVSGNAAMVAVDARTGQILASVSEPASAQFDQALDGQFPPGSTFKVLTATALMEKGLSPASPATCPPTITVDGKTFQNAEGDSPVSTMGQAFTESCNTAFVGLATSDLALTTFPAVAAQYGIGRAPKMGLPAAAGSVPTPKDQADLAATSIGQASVVVSPLNMAVVAATIDSGVYRPPRLVAGAADDTTTPTALPGAVVNGLREMMASVVTSGTAAGTGLPSGSYAKTGTAQYGSGNPLPTDAWLMGYRGPVAFAMVEQNSKGNGGPVDGPIIAKFLDALPANYG